MKPTDLRNATWREVQEHLGEDMLRVHAAWQEHGPCTTRALAEKCGISIFTVRPRTTELYDLGLVALVGKATGNEGVYAWVGMETAAKSWTGGDRPRSPKPTEPNAEEVARQVNTLPIKDQVSIAAAIMARAGHAKKHGVNTPGAKQEELSLA